MAAGLLVSDDPLDAAVRDKPDGGHDHVDQAGDGGGQAYGSSVRSIPASSPRSSASARILPISE